MEYARKYVKEWMIESSQVASGIHVATSEKVALSDLQKHHVIVCVERKEYDALWECAKRMRDACILSGDHDALDISMEFEDWMTAGGPPLAQSEGGK